MLASEVLTRGIHFTYSSDPDDLNKENLEKYDGLALYANYDTITAVQEEALLDFVKSGKGFIPIHAASFCFRNSDDFVEMLGGQFKQHGEGTFTSELTPTGKNHAIPVYEFETWDETYVHHKINPSINILMERVEDGHREPYTWTNNYGGGRIFYTAYGHDERTWSNPGFHDLMAEGILWAVGDRAAAKAAKLQFPVVEYTEARIPNYEKRDPPLKLQQPLSPQASMQLSQVPVGFELTLYASEPDIINPIAFSWDEKGRLWVIETVDYPNTVRTEDGVGDDRIKICEDTDGDGKADKFTIFADDLNIPTSMVFANDGVIVSQAPYFLFLQDTDGDDRADVREVVSSGWGVSDTHAGPSNLRYGFDNKIWGTIGYSAFDGVVDGVPTRFSSGVFRFNPDGTALEHVAATTNNTWGLGFSENFDVFASTANNNHSVHLGIYNGYLDGVKGLPQNLGDKIDGHYAMHPITQQVRQVDVFGGFTAAAGHSLYTARNFPKNYWNSIAFVCEPTGRLVHNAVLKQDGSGFREEDGWNLVASNDNWFGPVQAEVGPDGAVWIADWYNFIIQHNPTPPGFENGPGNAHINPLRDRKHGRIYRLAYQGAKQYRPVSLSKDDKNGLIQSLQNDNLLWRLTAQRLLVERGEKDVVPDLMNLIASQQVDDLGISPGAIHALWILHGLQVINGQMEQEIFDVVTDALKHTSAGVRKAAVQVLPGTERAAVALLSSGVLKDPNKNTQLAAILALSKMPSVDGVGEILLELSLDKDLLSDDLLSKSVYIAATRHKSDFLSALTSDKEASDRLADQLQQLKDPWEIDLDLTNWGVVEVPGMLEKTEIGEVDGTFWFRKEIDLNSSNKNRVGKIHLGAIRQTDETWVNGVKVGSTQDSWNKKRVYDIPAGLLKQGRNVVAVKVINNHFDGGFAGKPEDIRLEFAGGVIPLAGAWRYHIEHILTENYFSETNSIARNLLINYPSDGAPDPQVNEQEIPEDAILVDIKVIENEMKYDVEGFEVEAGKEVVIRFRNTDFMQHNLVIADQGSLEVVGEAADQMATSADGAAMNYVPEISQVLHATGLVDPRTEVVLRFTAPEEPGEYPFVCTFPGHWRIMNGVMKVIAPKIEAL
ncbi:MAG: hypothetical protein DHS20C17_21790 [Cyclobacteriaceae bacterium]|nr:MAG: hypothetical protein DHS20C17_21790 [Cyclobacteriaceae bacterium]